jgi:hypothetical protein
MRRILIVLSSLILVLLIGCAGKPSKTIEIDLLFYEYSYIEIKNISVLIAVIECIDDLSESNSVVEFDNNIISSFRSTRSVKIIQSLKGDISTESVISVIEYSAYSDGTVYTAKNYQPMRANGKYILFLSENSEGDYIITSLDNGRIDLDYVETNTKYPEIVAKTFIEYLAEGLTSEQRDRFVLAEVSNALHDFSSSEYCSVDTPFANLQFEYYSNPLNSTEYIWFLGMEFVSNTPIFGNYVD